MRVHIDASTLRTKTVVFRWAEDKKVIFETEDHKPQSEKASTCTFCTLPFAIYIYIYK